MPLALISVPRGRPRRAERSPITSPTAPSGTEVTTCMIGSSSTQPACSSAWRMAIAPALLDRGDEAAGDHPAADLVDELELSVVERLDRDVAVTELAASSRLLLV